MKNNLLVVGGTGFIGSVICDKLKNNFNIISISKKLPLNKEKKIRYLKCDILKYNEIVKVLKKYKIEYVINAGGNKKIKNLINNIHFKGINNLIKFLNNNKKIKKFIQIGSSEEYGELKPPHFENFFKIPKDDYGYLKLLNTFRLKYENWDKDFPSVILRPYSIFGIKQKRYHLIPQIIYNLKKNTKFKIQNPKIKRNFLYVEDFVTILELLLINKLNNADIVNIGHYESITILDMLKIIEKNFEVSKIYLNKNKNKFTHHYPNLKKMNKILKKISFTNYDYAINCTINL